MKKSPNDNKTYHSFTLQQGLRITLVEDKNCHKSACSLVVNTGSFDDPIDRPGFAHFIEHLLFNGNQAYPEPTLLNNFVAQHGGHCNAWTGTEHSCYHFDIQHEYFTHALDMFAHMFVAPLFDEAALAKEQLAIHSEYKLKLKDDSRRIQQVHKETCNKAHPFNKFTVGNRHTLSDLPGRPVVEELIDFYAQQYQAKYMTLAIVSPFSSDQLIAGISERFGLIKSLSEQAKPEEKKISSDLYLPEDLAQFVTVKPVKELHKLNITFALPSINSWYTTKIVSFAAHIIGYEGQGSLFEYLKEQGLINALSAGNGISGSNFKDFNISLELTESGEASLEFIIKEVFACLNQLRRQTIPEYLYKEQQRLAKIGFDFQEEMKSLKLVNHLALNMHHYPESDVLFGDYRMDGFNQQDWLQLFSYFRAENMRITLVSKDVYTDKEAKWYHTPYAIEKLSAEHVTLLNDFIDTEHQYQLPKPNPYLKQKAHLETPDFTSPIPISIDTSLGWQAWFKQDISFRVPKGNIYIGLDLPNGVKNKRSQAMMRLFCDLFMDTISEQHYQAEMAGLHYNLYAHHSGMTLYTSGLSNNQDSLVLNLLDDMLNMNFNKIRFDEVKRQLIKHWQNAENNKPISQLFALLNTKLLPTSASSSELAKLLIEIEFEEFSEFCKPLFEHVYADVLLYGNWTATQATAINQEVKGKFVHAQGTDELERSIASISSFEQQTFTKKVNHNDTAAVIYIQGMQVDNNKDHIEKAIFILLSQILSPFSFNYLREEKQLGYLAGSGYMPLCNVPGVAVYVQSHKHQQDELLSELETCLTLFVAEIEQMSEQDLKTHKDAVIHQYNELPSNMSQKSQQLWISIGNKDHGFDQKHRIATEIEKLDCKQLTAWCKANLLAPNLTCVRLGSIH